MASIDRLRPLWQPAMHLLYYFCVFSLFYCRINVELSVVVECTSRNFGEDIDISVNIFVRICPSCYPWDQRQCCLLLSCCHAYQEDAVKARRRAPVKHVRTVEHISVVVVAVLVSSRHVWLECRISNPSQQHAHTHTHTHALCPILQLRTDGQTDGRTDGYRTTAKTAHA